MSSGGSGQRQQREIVFCHQCRDEWYRDENGLMCPSCHSDFVEILENSTSDPTSYAGLPRHLGLEFDSDDDDRSSGLGTSRIRSSYQSSFIIQGPGFSIQRSTSGPGLGTSTTTTTTGGIPRPGSRPGEGGGGGDGGPGQANMFEMLQSIFASILGDQGFERVRQDAQRDGPQHHQSPAPAGGDHTPQDPRTRPQGPPGGFMFGGPNPPRATAAVVPVDDLPSVLQQLFGGSLDNPAGGMIHHIMGLHPGAPPGGDYVWSQGQLDRIISELMEQHQGNAPPPAPPEVLNNLPKVKVEQKRVLEGEDCAVCKDELVLEEEVAQLPCKHVYHEECIKRWLESRDTCPICRAPTAPQNQQRQQQQEQNNQQQSQQGQQQQSRRGLATLFATLSRAATAGGNTTNTTTTSSTSSGSSNNNNSNTNSSSGTSGASSYRMWPGGWDSSGNSPR